MASKRRHSQDDSGYIWFKDTSGEGALNLAWDLGSYISETDKEAGHGKSLRKWVEVTIKTTDGKTIKRKREVRMLELPRTDVSPIFFFNPFNRYLAHTCRFAFAIPDRDASVQQIPSC